MEKTKIEFHHNDNDREYVNKTEMFEWIINQNKIDAKMRESGEMQKIIDKCEKECLKEI